MTLPYKKILITAGPTREMFDPVRFLSNLSTGEMGYALARKAFQSGYKVTLISGPTALKPPRGVKFISVVSTQELKDACLKHFSSSDILLMTAAVCDFTAKHKKESKIHRLQTKELHLKRTPDIVAMLAKRKAHRKVIGFSLETEDWIESAKRKLRRKKLDGVVANYYNPKKHIPFGKRKVKVALIDSHKKVKVCSGYTKDVFSGKLLKWVNQL